MSTHPGGRPKGAKTKRRYRGVFKKCNCKWSKCRHAWHLTWTPKGREKPYRYSLDKMADWLGVPPPASPSEAIRIRFKVIERILSGDAPNTQIDAANPAVQTLRTVEDLVQPYLDFFASQTWRGEKRRPHRVPMLKNQLLLICRTMVHAAKGTTIRFGDKVFADITTPDIEAWRDAHREHMQAKERERIKRAERIAAGDAEARKLLVSPERPRARDGEVGLNRHLEVLRAWLNFGIRKRYYDSENPFYRHGIEIIEFTDEFDRSRRLEPGEENRLLAAADVLVQNGRAPHLYALIVAALESGCRRGELLSLQWRDVKKDAQGHAFIDLRAITTKTNAGRTIPISPRLAAILEMRRNAPDGEEHPPTAFVFGNSAGEQFDTVKTSWTSVCESAGIEDLHFHDLRREAGSRWLEGGINLLTVSKMLGHASVSMTDRYLKPSKAVNEREMREYHQRQTTPTKRPTGRRPRKKARPEARVH
jgi:integrase